MSEIIRDKEQALARLRGVRRSRRDHCRDKRPRQPPLVRIASHAIHQLDSADRQEPSLARTTKTTRLNEKIAKLKVEMQRLEALDVRMLATPDQQISLTDPDARSMATSGRGSGVVATTCRWPSIPNII